MNNSNKTAPARRSESAKYVKLTAKSNAWFKEGTEAYHYDMVPLERMTLEEWESWKKAFMVCCRGTRIAQNDCELHPKGEEYLDGESCLIEEFDVEIVDSKR